MFPSFFPQPKIFFSSFAIYSIGAVLLWYFAAIDWGGALSLGQLFGFDYPEAIGTDVEDSVREAYNAAEVAAGTFWFYQYFFMVMGAFIAFWFWYSPHPWQLWSVGGSALIFFVTFFLTQLSVLLNEWYGSFYDLVQQALSGEVEVTTGQYYAEIATFLWIALPYIMILVLVDYFTSHFVFRWRTAMNNYYADNWQKLRNVEGASQRVQEDTMLFADIMETLGVSFMRSVMVLIAFLPILWQLSAQVPVLPIVGEVSQGLVFIAIIWSIVGTALLALVGIRLPGLQFNNQKVEAAYRKELVYGEDRSDRADPISLGELFSNVRRNYFRLYFHYLYFNVVRYAYLQFGNIVPLIALGPTIASGAITFGFMNRVLNAFNQVENSFQYLINSWTTIVKLLSVYKRLQAFEAILHEGAAPPPNLPGAEPAGPEATPAE